MLPRQAGLHPLARPCPTPDADGLVALQHHVVAQHIGQAQAIGMGLGGQAGGKAQTSAHAQQLAACHLCVHAAQTRVATLWAGRL